jgi:CTP synthase
MNPTEHGEVFVLKDGMECDQDLGNYERFLNKDLSKLNYMTTGSIYLSVIARERNLEYEGRCVSVVPEIPIAVIDAITGAAEAEKAEIVVVEIGGTVGEYQNILFLEAYRTLKFRNPDDCVFALVSYLPVHNGELKSKPTQYAVRTANATGIQPDFIIARANAPIDAKRREKIAFNCNVRPEDVISAPDVSTIYDVPLNFEKGGLGDEILKKFKLEPRKADMKEWQAFVDKAHAATKPVKICIAGKYFMTGEFTLTDSYISVLEAVKQAAFYNDRKPEISWVDTEDFEKTPEKLKDLSQYDGVIVPGGFGSRGIEGKIKAIEYCRVNKIPYLGLCYGMQLQVVEYARNVVGLKDANTTEVNTKTANPVIDILPEQKANIINKRYGASMRLGNYTAKLKKGTIVGELYKKEEVVERHRHRYEVNPEYIERIEKAGLVFSGTSPEGKLMEFAELPKDKHPFFVGTQAHPELISRPLNPHPLFLGFIKAASERSK